MDASTAAQFRAAHIDSNVLHTSSWNLPWNFAPFQFFRSGGISGLPYISFNPPDPSATMLSTTVSGPGTLTWIGGGLDVYVDGALASTTGTVILKPECS